MDSNSKLTLSANPDETSRTVRWAQVDGFGAEHFHLQTTAHGYLAQGAVVGSRANSAYGVFYSIRISKEWLVQEVEVRETESTSFLHLVHDGQGHWSSPEGPVPSLDGCIDIDIAATPFTNTLPIRRLRLGEGSAQPIRVLYIPVPSLRPLPIDQRYTCLQPDQLYRYENLTNGYEAELMVDGEGLVVDYPNAFKRA
ncbi:glycolipid-binding domain-containing protein [Purpureocillium lavendulum]|uniref:Glycolipid-binding domain-containing protein n=1 Tax=Purpureocillium lavendulum TaxID=1247861 RepID=A0AB34FYW2_9HYPO|nr:glycolipid-binding domain-containing protein [Purpureocillium lavendulum]